MPNDRPAPRNMVVVLLDSLNRHMLGCYGGTEFATQEGTLYPLLSRLRRDAATVRPGPSLRVGRRG